MNDLRSMTLAEMKELARSLGQPAFRGAQLYGWIYKGETDFRRMHNLPEIFIQKLEAEYTADPLTLLREQRSSYDGTRKFLFSLDGGDAIESVFMKYHYGNSVCISSQAGCRMGCSFCASGMKGLARDLTPGEMISQVMDIQKITGEKVNHVVVMGTGEPFDNYENLSRFLYLLHDDGGFGLSMRNITVSTCGIIPGIRRFSEDFPQVSLAVSLHAADNRRRSEIMPVNRSYPLEQLIDAVRRYTEVTSRRVTFEFALIHGVNDRQEDVNQLVRLLRGLLCHVNLIPLNEVRGTGLKSSGRKRAEEIRTELESRGIPATVRRQLGADIDGACGQLRLSAAEEDSSSEGKGKK